MVRKKIKKPKRGDIVELTWFDPDCDAGWRDEDRVYTNEDYANKCRTKTVGIVWVWTSSWVVLCGTTDGEYGADSMVFYRPIITDWRIIDG